MMLNSKKGMEETVGMIAGVILAMIIVMLLLGNTWTTIGASIEETRGEFSYDFILSNTTAENLYGSNCWSETVSCVNTTGTETVASGNYSFTESTCSLIGTDGGDYNNTNITCSYEYSSGASGNLTETYNMIPEETTDLFEFIFIAVLISVIIGVYALWKKFQK